MPGVLIKRTVKTNKNHRWLFFLMLLSGIGLGWYAFMNHGITLRDYRYSLRRYSAIHDVKPQGDRFLTEAELAQYSDRIVQDYKSAVASSRKLAMHGLTHRLVISAVALLHFAIGMIGLWVTRSPNKHNRN